MIGRAYGVGANTDRLAKLTITPISAKVNANGMNTSRYVKLMERISLMSSLCFELYSSEYFWYCNARVRNSLVEK